MAKLLKSPIIKMWCYVCGKTTSEIVEFEIPCPLCTVPVKVKLCPHCARTLAELILNELGKRGNQTSQS